jgi:hypothetical protein
VLLSGRIGVGRAAVAVEGEAVVGPEARRSFWWGVVGPGRLVRRVWRRGGVVEKVRYLRGEVVVRGVIGVVVLFRSAVAFSMFCLDILRSLRCSAKIEWRVRRQSGFAVGKGGSCE